MFETDFSERSPASQALSKEDRKFLGMAERGIHKCADGHYEMPLPLREPRPNLPNNREIAARRLNQLKRRFKSDNKYRNDYVTFMDNIIKNGYAEKVPSMDHSTQTTTLQDSARPTWYIPHHGVYHPKNPNKIRVVFDSSAEFKGETLNKHLPRGPDLTNNLVGVLCRFRQEPIAFTCDIEAMFHQVRVSEECRLSPLSLVGGWRCNK